MRMFAATCRSLYVKNWNFFFGTVFTAISLLLLCLKLCIYQTRCRYTFSRAEYFCIKLVHSEQDQVVVFCNLVLFILFHLEIDFNRRHTRQIAFPIPIHPAEERAATAMKERDLCGTLSSHSNPCQSVSQSANQSNPTSSTLSLARRVRRRSLLVFSLLCFFLVHSLFERWLLYLSFFHYVDRLFPACFHL